MLKIMWLGSSLILQKRSTRSTIPFYLLNFIIMASEDLSTNGFASYLTSRSQYTMVNGFASSLLPLTHGGPQGSVLGPLLFLIYINDIGFIPNLNVKPKLFADDTNMFIRSQNLLDLQIKCQTAINKIYEWVLANR